MGTVSSKALRTSGVVGLFQGTCVRAKSLQSCPTLETPWTVALQAPLSMGYLSRQGYQSGWPFHPPGDLSNPGKEPCLLSLLHWQAGSLTLVPLGKPYRVHRTSVTEGQALLKILPGKARGDFLWDLRC